MMLVVVKEFPCLVAVRWYGFGGIGVVVGTRCGHGCSVLCGGCFC